MTEKFHNPASAEDYLNLNSINYAKERLDVIHQCEVDLSSGLCVPGDRCLWYGTLPVNSTARPKGPQTFLKDGYCYLVIADDSANPSASTLCSEQ